LVYDIRDIFADQHILQRGTIAEVHDDELGIMKMQSPLFKLQNSQGRIKWTGRKHAADTDAVLLELGFQPNQIDALRQGGEIR